VLIAIIVDPTAPVYSFRARRPPTRMPLALPLLQQLQCRASGFVQSGTDSVASWLADIMFGWLRSTTKASGLLAAVLGVTSLPAYAQPSWTGATSTDWFTGTNWNTGVVPTAADLVILNTITPNPTFVTGGAAVANILFVAQTGTGALTIVNGTMNITGADIGQGVGSQGTARVTGVGSTWTNSNLLSVGTNGTGTLTIENGGVVSNVNGFVGFATGSQGAVTVMGAGSTWTNSGSLSVGNGGTGTLTVASGGVVSSANGGFIGSITGSQGAVTVTGAGSAWTNGGLLSVGNDGTGALAVGNGGVVTSGLLTVGQSGTGTVTIGNGGVVSSGLLTVGEFGTGTLTIENGGNLITSIPGADIGNSVGSQGMVTVTGAGSAWTNSGLLSVGTNGAGTLTIANGGVVSNTNGFIGFATGSQGAVTGRRLYLDQFRRPLPRPLRRGHAYHRGRRHGERC
jgi:T5SS/PEP-CTERM-associated repeat protein